MSKQMPQDHRRSTVESINDDLEILNNMNIDEDFNIWNDFRASVAVKKKRESIESVFSKRSSSKSKVSTPGDIGDSHSSTSAVVLGVREKKFEASEISIAEINISGKGEEECGDDEKPHGGDNSLDVSFSTLTAGERRDLRQWEARLGRETVFSRYYFPEQWEMRELSTVQKFLELDKDSDTQWLNAPGLETTRRTVADIFYPGDHDAKSVLLKRAPVLFDGVDEREMLLFTHSFLFSRMEFDSLLNLLFTINSKNPECLNPKQLRDRFDAIDTDKSGSLDRCELKEMFKGMGVPVGERALSDMMERFDKDLGGTIEFDEFVEVMNELKPKKEPERWSWGSVQNAVGGMIKKTVTVEQHKLDCAYPLSDIQKVESINICSSEATDFFAHSSWADLVFAIFVKGRTEPLIMVCSKPEHREAWVDAFKTCCVKSVQLRADNGSKVAKKIRNKVGWQHILIQASLFSVVICNDIKALREKLADPSPDINVNEPDEYYGYTALHFAVIFGDIEKAKLLLQNGARVNMQGNDDKTPLDHAVLSENRELIELLESHGGKTNTAEPLFKEAIEEQKRIKSETTSASAKKTIAKAKDAAGAMAQGLSAMRERGERLEKLDNKTAQLQSDAQDYASLAKQMKEKNKKKAAFFGM